MVECLFFNVWGSYHKLKVINARQLMAQRQIKFQIQVHCDMMLQKDSSGFRKEQLNLSS